MTLPTSFTTGGLALASPFVLSPMEGVSDVGFRALCFQNGAGLTWTEMIRARGLKSRNKSTLDLVDTHDPDTLTGIQLLVTGPNELFEAVRVLEELAGSTHPHFKNICQIDLNFGCPSPDVIRIGAGPALLKRRAKLRAIFEALAQVKRDLARAGSAMPNVKSVSAKIRLGLHQGEQDHKVYLPVVDMANDTLDHLVVHARHAKQRSRDLPTWSAIGEAKAHAKIPIVGNGDVKTRADAERMHAETGCDAFMIARAAIKDPWCFRAFSGAPPERARPSVGDVEQARATYEATAARFATKEKFRAFHAESFARLHAVASGAGDAQGERAVVIPKNAHMS